MRGKMLTVADLRKIATAMPKEESRVVKLPAEIQSDRAVPAQEECAPVTQVQRPVLQQKKIPTPSTVPRVTKKLPTQQSFGDGFIVKDVRYGAESDIDYYLRTACNTPLLEFSEVLAIGREIQSEHRAWSTALFGMPALQEYAYAFLRSATQRNLLNHHQDGEEHVRVRQFIAFVRTNWYSMDATERQTNLLKIDVNLSWMQRVTKAAHMLYEAARKNLDHKDTERALPEFLQRDETCSALFRNIGSTSADAVAEAFASIPDAVQAHEKWAAAKQRLVSANTRLVVSIASRFRYKGLPFVDLIGEGMNGLSRAAELYDPELGNRFTTYGTRWVEKAIMQALNDKSRIVRTPSHVQKVRKTLSIAKMNFFSNYNRFPTDEELAAVTGIELTMIHDLSRNTLSADLPHGEGDTTIGQFLQSNTAKASTHTEAEQHSLQDAIRRIICTFPYREQIVISMRYGFGDGYPYSLEQTSKVLKVTRERIRQIEAKALERLRDPRRATKLQSFLSDEVGGG